MTYQEAVQYLASLEQFGMRPGTERLAQVLHRLDDPQQRFLAIHIAGTNGKGSTAAFCASLLEAAAQAAGQSAKKRPYKIGLYTSPHLARVRERIQLSASTQNAAAPLQECDEAQFAQALFCVQKATAAAPSIDLTFFEVLTAAAFLIFAEQAVDVAVVETGLGGRLDATRLCRAAVTVVTSIGVDHMEILGPTLCDIAHEKAGIFRGAVPALVACDDAKARTVLCQEAARVAAPLWLYDLQTPPSEAQPVTPIPPLPTELLSALPLFGAHQHRNAALALAAVAQLPHPLAEIVKDPAVQQQGLLKTRWPGRLERLWPAAASESLDLAKRLSVLPKTHSEVWIDAAHNPEGSQALAGFLDEVAAQRPLLVLFGVVAGKAATAMTAPLQRAAHIVLTRPPSPRGLDAALLAAELKDHSPSFIVQNDWRQALRAALDILPPNGLLMIYGSIFLIGAVRALWRNEPMDFLTVQDPAAQKIN